MRSKRLGVKGIRQQQRQKEKVQEKGQELETAKIEDMQQSLSTFKIELEKFARKHKKEINKDPLFRSQFNKMCLKIGVDPLASNKGFWGELLGVGDFYYELSVQIIEVCYKTRNINGGLIEINELLSRLKEKRGKNTKQEITIDDIKCSLDKVKSLGNGFSIINFGNKIMIKSVPIELNKDHSNIMNIADKTGFVTINLLKRKLGWPEHRIDTGINLLMKEGMCWIDKVNGSEDVYWFPSIYRAILNQKK